MSTLRGTSLVHSYDGVTNVLDGVDVAVAAGELVCVLGPNGAGKSTLVKVLAGLLAPDAGAVDVDGTRIDGLADGERARRVAVVPQNLQVIPDVRVREFVLGGRYAWQRGWLGPDAADHAVARECLQRTGTEALADQGMRTLSGGQRQCVLVARALAQATPLLLADEPTASLDPEHQLAVFSLLAAAKDEGRGVLAVTHDFNLASQFATEIVVLHRGRVQARGPVHEVLRPEVLVPVYGSSLQFGELPAADRQPRPFVLTWRRTRSAEQ